MRQVLTAGFCASAVLISGCSVTPKPAQLSDAPTADQRAELAQAITEMTGSRDWTYDLDTLFTEGRVIARPMDGMVNDRSMGKPMTFHIMKHGSECMMTSDSHSKSMPLSTIKCQTMESER